MTPFSVSRRTILRGGLAAGATAAGALLSGCVGPSLGPSGPAMSGVPLGHQHHTGDVPLAGAHGMHKTPVDGGVAEKLAKLEGFDPMAFLTAFDYGEVSKLPDGRTLREYEIVSQNQELEIAPGVVFPAWAFNGQVPGPTLRATEGDVLRIHFTNGS